MNEYTKADWPVGEIAHQLHTASGAPAAEQFMAQVRSHSLRLLESGRDQASPIGPMPLERMRSNVVRSLDRVQRVLDHNHSTSPAR